MGRPTKLTDESQQTIVGAIQLGMYQEQAARLAGIDPGTYYRWMENGTKQGKQYAKYREFRETVEKARAEAEARKLRSIHIAADSGTWQAAAWWLERSFPNRWGRRDKMEVIHISEDVLDAEIQRLEAELADNDTRTA